MTDGKDSSPHTTTTHSNAIPCGFIEENVFGQKERYVTQLQL